MFARNNVRTLAMVGAAGFALVAAAIWGGGSLLGGSVYAGEDGTPTVVGTPDALETPAVETPSAGGAVSTSTPAAGAETPSAGGGAGGSTTLPETGTGAGSSNSPLAWVMMAGSLAFLGALTIGFSAARKRSR